MTLAKPRMLFVDDRSKRIHAALRQYGKRYDVTIAPNVREALRLLSSEKWNVVSLDYDLDGDDFSMPESKTCGMEIIRHLLGWPQDRGVPEVIIHSSNIFGAEIMYRTLLNESHRIWHIIVEPFQYEGDE